MQNRGRHYFDILFKVTFFRCFATGCAGIHLDPLPASPGFACSPYLQPKVQAWSTVAWIKMVPLPAWSPLNPGELARTRGNAPVGVNRTVGMIELFTRGVSSLYSPGSGTLWHTAQTLSPVAEAPFNDWEDMREGPFLGNPCGRCRRWQHTRFCARP